VSQVTLLPKAPRERGRDGGRDAERQGGREVDRQRGRKRERQGGKEGERERGPTPAKRCGFVPNETRWRGGVFFYFITLKPRVE